MRIVVVGEGMIELSRADGGLWRLGHGGDTLNTAIHLARMGRDVRYVTALGDDPFSTTLLQDWAAEGIDTSLTLRDPTRMPGLYAITTDEAGERSFSYWRGQSAARTLSLPESEAVMVQAEQADLLLYSLITLAILDEPSREHLFDLAQRVRARGGRVAFDGNYRPRLFASQDEARELCRRAIGGCDIGLPTLEDEAMLVGPVRRRGAGSLAGAGRKRGRGEAGPRAVWSPVSASSLRPSGSALAIPAGRGCIQRGLSGGAAGWDRSCGGGGAGA